MKLLKTKYKNDYKYNLSVFVENNKIYGSIRKGQKQFIDKYIDENINGVSISTEIENLFKKEKNENLKKHIIHMIANYIYIIQEFNSILKNSNKNNLEITKDYQKIINLYLKKSPGNSIVNLIHSTFKKENLKSTKKIFINFDKNILKMLEEYINNINNINVNNLEELNKILLNNNYFKLLEFIEHLNKRKAYIIGEIIANKINEKGNKLGKNGQKSLINRIQKRYKNIRNTKINTFFNSIMNTYNFEQNYGFY